MASDAPALSAEEILDFRSLMRGLRSSGWVGIPLLRGGFPQYPTVATLPAAGQEWAYATLVLEGTPDIAYTCLRSSGGTWTWVVVDNGAVAPTNADYLVGTANAGLSAEIVVGTSPGGELGGSWATPTVDATHSGSAHHTRSHTMPSTSDHTATAHRTFYADGSGNVQELAYGAQYTILESQGASTAPSWQPRPWRLLSQGAAGSTVSSISFTSLTNKVYRLTLFVNQVTASDILYLRLNGDSGSNYDEISGGIAGAAAAQFQASSAITTGEHAVIEIIITKPVSSEEAMILSTVGRMTSATVPATEVNACQWNNTAALVTSIVLSQAATGQFGSQTYYILEGSG